MNGSSEKARQELVEIYVRQIRNYEQKLAETKLTMIKITGVNYDAIAKEGSNEWRRSRKRES